MEVPMTMEEPTAPPTTKEGANDVTFPQDFEVRKSVWEGAIPVVFRLHPEEVTSLQPPDPYYLLIPRGTYFPAATTVVRKYFLLFTTVVVDDMWLDYNDLPLKWHYPVGVLFDQLASPRELPWSVTVHFQRFPGQSLLRCPNDEVVKSHFMNVLKEANFLKHGDSSKVNQLSVEDQNALWQSLLIDQFSSFWRVNEMLMPDVGSVRHLPVRFIRKGKAPILEPVTPLDDKGRERTLGDVLHAVLPEQFRKGAEHGDSEVVVQGITPPLNTPMFWLVQHCAHPDNFLYIIVK